MATEAMDDGFDVTTEAVIGATPELVFEWLLDQERICEWADGLIEYSWTEPGPVQVGSTYHQVFQLGGRLTSAVGEVLEYEPPHLVVSLLEARGVRARNELRLHPVERGTRVEVRHSVTVRGRLAKLLFPIMRVTTQRRMARTIDTLKQLIEASLASPSSAAS